MPRFPDRPSKASTAPALSVVERAAIHAALGDPTRLAVVDDLVVSDRSPAELCRRLSLPSNLLAHHLEVLVSAGIIRRSDSEGDRRRKYVQLVHERIPGVAPRAPMVIRDVLFVCTRNSARSQLAAALWTRRTGHPARSAGTDPAPSVHRRAVAAAARAGLELDAAVPRRLDGIDPGTQVITVCDRVHEELDPDPSWWHWSVPDPVRHPTQASFDAALAEIDRRIRHLDIDTGADR